MLTAIAVSKQGTKIQLHHRDFSKGHFMFAAMSPSPSGPLRGESDGTSGGGGGGHMSSDPDDSSATALPLLPSRPVGDESV